MKITARNQITIVDLNDAKSVQVYFTASQGFSQGYNPDTNVYTPNYPTQNNTITPKVYESGDATEHLANCMNVVYMVNGTAITASTNNANYAVNAAKQLVIKGNLTSDLNVTFTADYVDADHITSKIGGSFAVIRNVTSGALFSVVLTCPKGNVFDNTVTGDLTVTAQCFRGSVADNAGNSFTWEQFDTATGAWKAVASGRANGATLTVKPADVLNFQTFRVLAHDNGGNGQSAADAQALVTFQDLTDPYTVELYCPTGDKIVNGTGQTTISARIWQSGTKIEDEATAAASRKFDYTWTKFDKDGKPQNWNGTTSNVKTGNPITVLAAEVAKKTTIVCEITKK
ncbi:hypothetical protein [Prevotella melaninogenica]|uniref:Uncharacterized protein n=1 Tax=Prevotella melaninogenica DNF00666 TaxID=1401073 RepID=A0A096AGU2_9BACT|nr:hypothetical protein [Prevotella melaninogenica]KGF46328.1 hypothetical protein HMPREF0661_08245 [Prevotella melaninogenica DNF00666]